MEREYGTHTFESIKHQALMEQRAFHEAGHVTALYRCKKHNNFPDSFFPDDIKLLCSNKRLSTNLFQYKHGKIALPISGERNIIPPPVSLIETRKLKPLFDKNTYQPAYKANIINLLAGPLAEAKHISLRDDESFNAHLIHVNALNFYSGAFDLENAYVHLDNFINVPEMSHEVMSELFNRAFAFIDAPVNWKAIASLAGYILKNNKKTISCAKAFAVLDECVDILTKVLLKAEKPVLSF